MHHADHLVVITGGPGSGKTTLIDALAALGYARIAEAGRSVIQSQLASGGPALPWDDRQAFAKQMLKHEVRSYRTAQRQSGPVLCDRGIPDIVGYLQLEQLPASRCLLHAAHTFRYHRRVFIAPPWPEIYRQDAERKQTPEIAEQTWHAMISVYRNLGYELIDIPLGPVAARVRFMQEHIGPPPAAA